MKSYKKLAKLSAV